MTIKCRLKGFLRANWIWIIFAVASFFMSWVMFFLIQAERMENRPVITEGVAYPVLEVKNGLDLYDENTIIQEFISFEGEISHVGIGISSFRNADPEAQILVSIVDWRGGVVKTANKKLKEFYADDYRKIAFNVLLNKQEKYQLRIESKGIKKENAVSLYYEPKINSYEDGELFIVSKNDSAKHRQVGHIGFQIIRYPTIFVLKNIVYKNWTIIVMSFVISILFTYLFVGWRKAPTFKTLKEGMDGSFSPQKKEKSRTMLVMSFALILSVVVTFPFYTNLNKMDSMGDVQRNLLFRALGRDSLLNEGRIAQWDPFSCGGVPLLANIESAHLDPFFLLSLLFGENIGLRLSVTLTLVLGFLGTFLIARRFLRANFISSLLAGVLFSFSGFQMLAFSTGVFAWIPVGWIPLFVYFYLRSLENYKYFIVTAFILTFIFLGGGPHMPVFSTILVLFLATGFCLYFKTFKPILIFILTLILAALFSAVKLIPALELVSVFDSFHRAPSFIAPFSWIYDIFISRNQDISRSWNFILTGENYRWSEFGSYVGILPVLIFLFGIPLYFKNRKALVWFVVALFIFLMVFGFWPWTLIQKIPVVNEIVRNPQRLRSVLMLPFAVLVAYSLTILSAYFLKKSVLRNFILGLMLIIIVVDLLLVNAKNFKNLYDLEWKILPRSANFIRVNGAYTNEDSGYYKAGYINYLANEGFTDMCVPNMWVNRRVVTVGKGTFSAVRPYRGEAYFLSGSGRASLSKVSSTEIVVDLNSVESDGWLILNQNYFPGWKSEPEREISTKNGLLAVRVRSGDAKIILRYKPVSYVIGFWVSVVGILLSLVFLSFNVFKRKNNGV